SDLSGATITTGRGACASSPAQARQARMSAKTALRSVWVMLSRRVRRLQPDNALEGVRIDRLALSGDDQSAFPRQVGRGRADFRKQTTPLLRLQRLGHVGGADGLARRRGLQPLQNGALDQVGHRVYMLQRKT